MSKKISWNVIGLKFLTLYKSKFWLDTTKMVLLSFSVLKILGIPWIWVLKTLRLNGQDRIQDKKVLKVLFAEHCFEYMMCRDTRVQLT